MRALLVTNFELAWQPRLLKAGDSLCANGYDIDVCTVRTGSTSDALEHAARTSRNWQVNEVDLRKHSASGRLRWAAHAAIETGMRKFRIGLTLDRFLRLASARGLWAVIPPNKRYDVVYSNQVLSWPVAVHLANRTGARLILDSQEFHSRQFASAPRTFGDLVKHIEHLAFSEADIILSTTEAMALEIVAAYPWAPKPVRVRNLPPTGMPRPQGRTAVSERPWQLFWQGAHVALHGRGVDLAIRTLAVLGHDFRLVLQGQCSPERKADILTYARSHGCEERIGFLPPSPPDEVILAHAGHHIGLSVESENDGNTSVTSSNKLFCALAAGMPIMVPNLPGLMETAAECKAVVPYQFGSHESLAASIRQLADHPDQFAVLQDHALEFSRRNSWETDFGSVLRALCRVPQGTMATQGCE